MSWTRLNPNEPTNPNFELSWAENTKSRWKEKWNGKFLNRLIFEVGKCHSPSLIGLEICFNMQKQFLKKFENFTRYATTFVKSTYFRNMGVAWLVVLPHPSPHHHFGPKTWQKYPESLRKISSLVLELFNFVRRSTEFSGQF